MHKKDRLYLLILLVIFVLTRAFLLIQPFAEIDGYALTDDTYLSLKIAKNIAEGYGMTYGGIPTNGFQPLYVILMVPVYYLIASDLILPVYIALLILSVFSLLSAVVFYKLILKLFRNSESAFITSLVFVITPALIRNTTNGLETSISFFFFLLVIYLLYLNYNVRLSSVSFRKIFIFGAVLGLAVLARIDALFLFITVFFWTVVKFREEKPGMTVLIKSTLFLFCGFAVIYLPWLITSYVITGMFYPVSGDAVRIQGLFYAVHRTHMTNFYLSEIYRSLRYFVLNYFIVLAFIGFSSVFLIVKYRFRFFLGFMSKKHFPLIITSVLFYLIYVFYISAFWYFPRYLVPLFIPLAILFGYLLKEIFSAELNGGRYRILFYVLITVFVLGNITRPGFKDFYFGNYQNEGYYRIAKWASENLKDSTRLGSMQTGALGYFAENIKVYNLDGVVNSEALSAIKKNRLMDYIKENKIEYILSWNINNEFIKLKSHNFKESDLEYLFKIDGIKSWDYEWELYKVNY